MCTTKDSVLCGLGIRLMTIDQSPLPKITRGGNDFHYGGRRCHVPRVLSWVASSITAITRICQSGRRYFNLGFTSKLINWNGGTLSKINWLSPKSIWQKKQLEFRHHSSTALIISRGPTIGARLNVGATQQRKCVVKGASGMIQNVKFQWSPLSRTTIFTPSYGCAFSVISRTEYPKLEIFAYPGTCKQFKYSQYEHKFIFFY